MTVNRILFCLLLSCWMPVFTTAQKSVYSTQNSNLGFIENKGQIVDQNYNPNPDVFYLLNTPGMNVQLRRSGFSYDIYGVTKDSLINPKARHEEITPSSLLGNKNSANSKPTEFKFHRIDFDFIDSNPGYKIVTDGVSSGFLNFYTAGTPAEGVNTVRSFSCITYKDIYPGIDIEFISDPSTGFKYNIMVHPEGHLSSIKIRIADPEIQITPEGSLLLNNTAGSIAEEFPHSFFLVNSEKCNTTVRFRLIGKDTFGLEITGQNYPNATLIIDPRPVRIWSTYYGGSNMEIIYSCWFDSAQNVYITGWTGSSDNIATAGSFQSYYAGNYDAFVAKFDPDGQRLWGTYYGGSGNEDWIWSAIDPYGNIYMTGHTNSTTNIATPGAYQISRIGSYDAFLVKFNANGFRCWGTYYGGMGYTSGFFCSVDDSCKIYFGGETSVASGIASPGAYQTSLSGVYDGFLAKFDSSGQRVWATYYGGSNYDQARQCSAKNSVVFLSGETQSNDGIATMGSFQTSYGGVMDCWLAKFNTSGQLQWGTYYGGSLADRIGVCVADSNENVFLSGYTSSPDNIATPGSFQVLSGGNTDGFLAKFNSAGQRLWGTYYGGASADIVWGCSADDSMHVYIFGQTSSGSDIASPDGYQTSYGGSSSDAFLIKFTNNGERVWGTYYGDTGMDFGYGCSVDPCGHICFAGYTTSENNITTPGSFQSNYAGNTDGFLVKFADCNGADSAKAITGPGDICQNTNGLSFTVPIIAHATGYNWTVPPGFSISGGGNTNSITVNISGNAISGNISVYGTNCCQNGAPSSLYVTVHSRPIPDISGNDTICQGASSTYYTESGKSQYQWTVSSGGTITGGGMESDTSVTVLWSIPGSQWVSLNYTDTNDCAGLDPTVKNIEILNGIPVNVTITESSNNICLGTPVTFTATPFNGGTTPTYQWKVNSVNAGTDTPVFTYSPTNGDMVQCILTSSNTVCTSNNPATSNEIQLTVLPAPEVTFTPCFDTITTTNSKPIRLRGGVPLGGMYSGVGVESVVSGGSGIRYYFDPGKPGPGTHEITYNYINSAGCKDSATIFVLNSQFSILNCGDSLTDIRDNKKYPTVLIGPQCWMASNLNYGTMIPFSTAQRDNCIPEKYLQPPPGLPQPGEGSVYQWDEVMQYDDAPGLQGLCPPGWHVPSESDWNQLFSFYQNNAFAGAPLKYTGYSGFNAFPNGAVFFNRDWYLQDFATFFWSSTSLGPDKAWAHGMNEHNYSVSFYPAFRVNAFPVRCIRD